MFTKVPLCNIDKRDIHHYINCCNLSEVYIKRVSVVPYILKNDSLFFLLARDKNFGDITDLGGCSYSDESALEAGIREFKEESFNIFDKEHYNPNSYSLNLGIIHNRGGACTIFLAVKEKWLKIATKKFIKKKQNNPELSKKKGYDEISELIWFDEMSFDHLRKLEIDNTSTENQHTFSHFRLWKGVKNYYKNLDYQKLREQIIGRYPYLQI